VLATQAVIENLAERIERAYRLRRSGWYRGCSSSRVWSTAAAILAQLHQDDSTLPLDPELYVAVQPASAPFDDPWIALTQPSSARRYRCQVRALIAGLCSELRAEVRSAERLISRGETIAAVLSGPNRRLSSMSRYIIAVRAGRAELAERYRYAAIEQHRSCPLYRPASLKLLPHELYPVREHSSGEELVAMTRHHSPQPHLN